MYYSKEKICAYALSRIFIWEPRVARKIVENFGSAEAFFEAREKGELSQMGPLFKYSEAIEGVNLDAMRKELEECRAKGFRYLIYDEPGFPALLNECEDAPLGFFVMSSDSDEKIFSREGIAIVGTRDISPYGSQWCRKIVECLGQSKVKPSIVSGLAYGVDITAQMCALEVGLPTIAVLGTPIDHIYPTRHINAAERIAATAGSAVISEYSPFCELNSNSFLFRNRIIAGLSRASILIESKLKGGGMSTLRTASSYNRECYALVGSNNDLRSQGCNFLVHSHIAEPIIGCDELFRSLGYKMETRTGADTASLVSSFFSGSMDSIKIEQCIEIVNMLSQKHMMDIEEISSQTGWERGALLSLLRRLENNGFINIDLLQRCTLNNSIKKM